MTEDEVIQIIRAHLERQFPRDCNCCGRTYTDLADLLGNTRQAGQPISLDAELGDWEPERAIGTYSMANCQCGTTLTMGSRGMRLKDMWHLLAWARRTSKEREITLRALLDDLRKKIDIQVLGAESAARRNRPPSQPPR